MWRRRRRRNLSWQKNKRFITDEYSVKSVTRVCLGIAANFKPLQKFETGHVVHAVYTNLSCFFYTNRNAFKHTKPTVPDNIFVFVLSSDVAAKLPISFTKSLQLIFQFSKMWEQKSSKAPKYLFILNPWFRAHCLPTREIKEKDRVLTAAAAPRFGSWPSFDFNR